MDREDDPGRIRSMLRVFEIRLLYFLGIHPGLDHCGSCGKKTAGSGALETATMAVLCPDCAGRRGREGLFDLGRGFTQFYRDCLARTDDTRLHPDLAPSVEERSRNFFKTVFLNYLGKKLKVLEVRRDLAR
jgi:recombinational DNA repair protein (RecF pathway)